MHPRHRARPAAPPEPVPPPEPPAPRSGRRRRREERTLEEQAFAEARRATNRRVGFLMHFVPYAATCTFLLFVSGFRAAMVVALAWGIAIACHFFAAVIAPRVRRQIFAEELRARLPGDVARERHSLRGEHARRLEELSASIAHEIRNPITAAKSLVQQMGEDPASRENVEYAKVALEELGRVERSISHLLRYAREGDVELHELQVADVVSSALEALRDRVDAVGAEIETDLDEAGALRGDPEKLRRVLLNLVGNALDAFEEAGTPAPRIRIQAGENLAGSEVWLRVVDNGPGIDPARLGKVFDPFHTSKSNGTGLGLAISKKLVDAHGGSLEVQSSGGAGSEFVITLPKHQRSSPSF